MLRPIAAAAKMITCVAMDMFASEPPWVNGKQERHYECGKDQYLPVALGSPGEKAHDADPEEHRNERPEKGDKADEGAAIVDIQRERRREQGCPIMSGDRRGSRASGLAAHGPGWVAGP